MEILTGRYQPMQTPVRSGTRPQMNTKGKEESVQNMREVALVEKETPIAEEHVQNDKMIYQNLPKRKE